jgi:hypothetical protein
MWDWDPEKNLSWIPDPGQGSKRHRIPNPEHWCSVNITSVIREALEEVFRVRAGHYRQDEQESKLHLQENGHIKKCSLNLYFYLLYETDLFQLSYLC